MQVVGVDFGTTNLRISTWDSEQAASPDPKSIGAQGEKTMPTVVALQRQSDGRVTTIVGDAADTLENAADTLVIPIIKQLALSTDDYVEWHLKNRGATDGGVTWPPPYWNTQTRCVEAFGEQFPVWDLVGEVLKQAFQRANITGDFEWRAGCPVHADLRYRAGLADTLGQVTGKQGVAHWILEEPVLFLLAARRLGELPQGSYLLYDVGGGSFDCALVEVRDDATRIFGAEGHPQLGGSYIDNWLDQYFQDQGHDFQRKLLRQGKESLSLSNPSYPLQNNVELTLNDIEAALKKLRFREQSVSVSRDAYVGAKMLWKRPEGPGYFPMGEALHRYSDTGEIDFVWQLKWDNLVSDVDAVILFGGQTKSHFFGEYLGELFKDAKFEYPPEPEAEASELGEEARSFVPKVITAEMLDRQDFDLAITGASIGACYSWEPSYDFREIGYTPTYANRLPVLVTLQDLQTGKTVEYQPFQHFTPSSMKPFADFVSPDSLPEHPNDPHSEQRYELTVTDLEGVVLERLLVDPHIDTRLMGSTLRLVIDRQGRVGVEQESENSSAKRFMVLDNTPWQTDLQREFLNTTFDADSRYRKENSIPFGWGWRTDLKD